MFGRFRPKPVTEIRRGWMASGSRDRGFLGRGTGSIGMVLATLCVTSRTLCDVIMTNEVVLKRRRNLQDAHNNESGFS